MTYRDSVDDLAEDQDRPTGEYLPARPASPPLLGFTMLEDRVIALARTDGIGSIEEPGLIERLVAVLFGLRLNSRALADERLEALRQAVVTARHRHHLPDAQATRLQSHGFTLRQIREIEARALAA
jgi:hypothetical protein